MQENEIDQIFESFFHNGLRIIGDSSFQKRVWVNGEGPEVGEMEEDIGFALENSETLIEKADELSENRRKYVTQIRHFHDMLENFYHNIVYKNPNEKIINLIGLPEWKNLQHFSHTIYKEIQEEFQWKN